MKEVLFYNSCDIFTNPYNHDKLKNVPGGEAFSSYFQLFSPNISVVDRTGVIRVPLNVHTPDYLKMPEYKKFDKDFTTICDERAKFLLHKAEFDNRKIAVMYSGGIDSTLVLCSILKNATKEQLKNVVVLLSEQSISENENFYRDYITKNFECVSSYRFPHFLGNDKFLFTSGENADQLFGSQVNDTFTRNNPYDTLFRPIKEVDGKVLDLFNERIKDKNKKYSEPILNLFHKLVASAPIPLENVYQFFWWINFTTKWNSVYVRMLPYSKNSSTIKLEENYTTFFGTEDFQLWSLNNTDKFSKDVDNCGKKISKQYILDVNGDTTYLKKPKIGSLCHIVRRKEVLYTIGKNLEFNNEYPTEEYYNYGNDFEEMMK